MAMANTAKDPLLSQQGQPNLSDPAGGATATATPTQQSANQPAAPGAAPAPQPTAAPAQGTAAPQPWTMPPPPPMPPPADYSGLHNQLIDYSSEWLENPNRYLSDLAQAQRAEMDARLDRQRTEGTRNIEEWAAGRGLVGSQGAGMEGGHVAQLEGYLNEQQLQEELGLLQMLAGAETADRQAAGNMGLDLVRVGQDQRQFETGLSQRESEFARSFGLDERRFAEQQNQFVEEVALRRDEMAQDDRHLKATLEDRAASRALESRLRGRALDLQEQGMSMDEAYRRAALDQERDLTLSAQSLQREGMKADNAYRYAALSQDSRFRQRALDLQEQGMSQDEAYRQAELEYRRERGAADDKFRDKALMTDLFRLLSDPDAALPPWAIDMLKELFPGVDFTDRESDRESPQGGPDPENPRGPNGPNTDRGDPEDTPGGEAPDRDGTYEGETVNGYIWYNGEWI